jgi:hypothetical protein
MQAPYKILIENCTGAAPQLAVQVGKSGKNKNEMLKIKEI